MQIFRDVPQVLFVRVGALGDLLISTAALEKTFERFPDSQVWVFGERFWLELLKPETMWPRLNGIIVKTNSNQGQLYVPQNGQWKKEGEPQPLKFFFQKVQATVNLRIESYRYAWGPWFAKVPIRIGSCPWPMKWLYTHWSPWLGKEPLIHERDWYTLVTEAPPRKLFPLGFESLNRKSLLGARTRPQAGLPRLKEPDSSTIQKLTQKSELGSLAFGQYYVVNPTSSRVEKAWPAEKFREFCLTLKAKLDAQDISIIVVGAPHETEWLKKVAGREFHLVQPPTLGDLIDVIAGARVLIANTSSVQFIAAGTKTPTVTLMGRTNSLRWGPVGANDRVVQGVRPTPSVADIFEEERKTYESIEVREVVAACEKLANFSRNSVER